jgi:hypothetical protein
MSEPRIQSPYKTDPSFCTIVAALVPLLSYPLIDNKRFFFLLMQGPRIGHGNGGTKPLRCETLLFGPSIELEQARV